MPTHSPGTAGRSTALEAQSYSSMCFQTAKAQEEGRESLSGQATSGQGGRGRYQDPGTCQSLCSHIGAKHVKLGNGGSGQQGQGQKGTAVVLTLLDAATP